jgi:VanZ family protein
MLTFAARLLAWALAAIITYLSLVPPGLRPETGAPHDLEHFAIFALTGLAFRLGYDRRHLRMSVLLVAFSAAIETAQLFVPGRHARLGDFLVDALALTLGVLAANLIIRANAVPQSR